MKPKEVIEKWVELLNQGNALELSELYHDHAVNHQVANLPVEGKKAIFEMFNQEFQKADMVCIIEHIYEDVQWAILEWKDPIGLRGSDFFQIENDKILF